MTEPPPIDPAFIRAVDAAMTDHTRYGDVNEGWNENGAMRAVGIARADSVRMFQMMFDEFGSELAEGGPPLANSLLAIIEIALSTGVHLERNRWESNDTDSRMD